MVVGIGYNNEDNLNEEPNGVPYISLVEHNLYAQVIIEAARKYNVSIIENKDLCKELQFLKPGTSIPKRFFEIIAVILKRIKEAMQNRKTFIGY